MSNTTKTLQLVIAGENKGAVTAVDGVGRSVTGLQGNLKGLGAGLAGVLSVGAITAVGKKIVDQYTEQAGNVAKIKRLTGESAQNASLLSFAAQQSGVDATKATTGWQFLAKNIANGKVAAEGIATVGGDGKLLPFEQILGKLADRFQQLPPGADRTALALKLFGKSGADMVKILQNGSAGIEAQRQKMQDLGLEFNDAGLKKYFDFVKAQRDMKAAMAGVEIQIANGAVPVLTKLATAAAKVTETFGKLPAPVRDVVLAVGGVGVAVAGTSAAVGAFGPLIANGLRILHLMGPAGVEAAAGAQALTVATLSEADAAIAAAAANESLVAAWVAGVPATEAAAVSRETLAAADAAEATSAEGAATANVGLAGALPIVGLGVAAVAAGLYANKLNDAHASATQLSTASNADLVKLAATYNQFNPKAFVGIGRESLTNLKAMQAAVKDAGGSFPALDAAIAQVTAEQKLATDRTKKYSDATDTDTAAKKRNADVHKEVSDKIKAANDAVAQSVTDAERKVDDNQKAIDSDKARLKAVDDLATAQRAANGDSDAYRQATQAITQAQKDEVASKQGVVDAVRAVGQAQKDEIAANQGVVDAIRAVGTAQEDVNKARVDAARVIDNLNTAERDAVLAQHESQANLRSKLADPNATALDREKASVGLADANDKARQATQDHSAAAAKGVEGSDQVVAARQKVADASRRVAAAEDGVVAAHQKVADESRKVADAENKVRESVDKVAAAQDAQRKVIVDAKAAVVVASQGVDAAVRTEADAWGTLAAETYGANAGLNARIDILRAFNGDPTLLAALQALQAPPTHDPHELTPEALAAQQRPRNAVNLTINNHGTARQNDAASAAQNKAAIDKIFSGTFGG